MKKLLVTVIALTAMSLATNAQTQKFKLVGQIVGTQKGDTLRFEKINIDYTTEPGFDVIIGKNGALKYNGEQEHIQYYGATYLPVDKTIVYSDKRWINILVSEGTTNIQGTRENIYYPTLKGGVYDGELQELLALENSFFRIRNGYNVALETATANNDTLKIKEYRDLFNNFYYVPSSLETIGEIKKLKAAYHNETPSEYTAHIAAIYGEYDEKVEMYAKLTPELKESYYGKLAEQGIATLALTQPGQMAPEFTLLTTKGDTITLETFKGKDLLVYHFGLCPGSMQIDEHVAGLFNRNKDSLNVLSFVKSKADLQAAHDRAPAGAMLYGMDMKAKFSGMLNHPWQHEVDGQGASINETFEDDYVLKGLPYFYMISPEGKIISKGYSLQQVLKEYNLRK